MTTTERPGTAWHKTACILCECNCGLEIQLDGRRLAKIRGDKEHPASAGYTCEKPLRLDRYQNSAGRLTSPLRRNADGGYDEIDWDTAIAEITARLVEVRDTHGGDKIFFYGGGGQGNHFPGAYGKALRTALGSVYHSNALAQEKTGEAFVDGRLYGGHTKGDFEHAEVVLFLGKNPWQSHSFPRARPTLKAIAADPDRAMIVIDPRRTETAELADFHLQVRPGTDAWCLAAMLAILVDDDLLDHDFLAEHATGADEVLEALRGIPVPEYAEKCGVDEELIRAATHRFAAAATAATFEDLGTQQAPNSTLVSYLNKLLWILTGNFGRPGTMFLHSSLVPLFGSGRTRTTPVTGAPIISGLVPCNSITEEILTDHPDRLRAMWVDAANPAHSLVESARFAEALRTLELVVVVDVAFTETARLADYVLPAATQFEKWEATFFNFEFPHNVFQLRPPLLEPAPGTLPEAEIYSRILRELGAVDAALLDRLREAAGRGREAFAPAFFEAAATDPAVMPMASYVLYETLGPTLPRGAASAAFLWGAAHQCAMRNRDAMARAGFDGDGLEPGERLFDAILSAPAGVAFTVDDWDDVWHYVRGGSDNPDRRFTVAIPELLDDLRGLADAPYSWTSAEFPFVLAAGERRAFTANTIIRDPGWRRRDAGGALRISPADAERLGLGPDDRVRVVTEAGSAETTVEITDTLRPGHITLPNGLGLDHPDGDGDRVRTGVAPNELTSARYRDRYAGTPWHKHTPARLEPVETG